MTNNDRCNFSFKIISNFTTGANIGDSSMLNVNAQPFVPVSQWTISAVTPATQYNVSNCDRSSSSEDRYKFVQSKAKSLARLNKDNN